MKLAIISHTPHYLRDGTAVGWGATVREIDQLARLFDEIAHIAPLHEGEAPGDALPYASTRVRLVPVAPAGGTSWGAKLGILSRVTSWTRTISKSLEDCQMVHVRLPANISALALVALSMRRQPPHRWFKYAGDWQASADVPVSYRLQRRLLSRSGLRGIVTVSGDWPGQPDHVHPVFNPCLSEAELDAANQSAAEKRPTAPLRLLFVGRLDAKKGIHEALEVSSRLHSLGIDHHLDIVGDGGARALVEARMAQGACLTLHGWIPRQHLDRLYGAAHILLFPSHTEGWPKVLSEAMAHGAVPVSSDISCIGRILTGGRTGSVVDVGDTDGFVRAVTDLARDPERWSLEARAAARLAANFTYESYLETLRNLFRATWDLDLSIRDPME